jgi:hypothetical protein
MDSALFLSAALYIVSEEKKKAALYLGASSIIFFKNVN